MNLVVEPFTNLWMMRFNGTSQLFNISLLYLLIIFLIKKNKLKNKKWDGKVITVIFIFKYASCIHNVNRKLKLMFTHSHIYDCVI